MGPEHQQRQQQTNRNNDNNNQSNRYVNQQNRSQQNFSPHRQQQLHQNNKRKFQATNNNNSRLQNQQYGLGGSQHPDSSVQQHSSNRDVDQQQQPSNNPNHANTGSFRFIPGASTKDLPPIETKMDPSQKKFTGRCRLFVGNLPHNTPEQKVREIFEPFGEIGEVFLGAKSAFAFIKMDTRKNAELARDQIDCSFYDGRVLRVRLAAHAAAIRVKNLSSQVTNELLAYAFRHFGEIERAVVVTDDKGKSTGEGVVEYHKKAAALYAIKRCQQDCFLLTANPIPVSVEAYDQQDEEEGLPERSIAKHSQDFMRERELGPRFSEPGTFEHSVSLQWKELFANEKLKREQLEEELKRIKQDLQNQIESLRLDHDEIQLKNQLKQLEDNRIRLKRQQTELPEQQLQHVQELQYRPQESSMNTEQQPMMNVPMYSAYSIPPIMQPPPQIPLIPNFAAPPPQMELFQSTTTNPLPDATVLNNRNNNPSSQNKSSNKQPNNQNTGNYSRGPRKRGRF